MPERELQLRPAAYSRQWENARLSALYRMARGDAPVVVTTAAALVQRCLSREVLLAAAEAGASIIDVMGDLYDPSPMELTSAAA